MTAEWRLLRSGALTAFASRGVVMFLGLGASMLLARLLPQDELGSYFLVLNAVNVVILLSMFGSTSVLQRFIGKFFVTGNWCAIRQVIVREIRVVAVVFTVVAGMLLIGWERLAAFLQSPAMSGLAWVILILVAFGIVQELASVYFRSVRRMKIGIFLLELPMQLLFVLGLFAAFGLAIRPSLGEVISWRAASLVLTGVLAGALALWDLNRRQPDGYLDSAPDTGELVRIGLPLAAHGLAAWLLVTTDLWFLGIFRPGADVGVYGAITRLVTLIGSLLMLVNLVLPSLLAGLYEQGRRAEIEQLMRRIATVTGWIALLVFSIFVIGGDWLVGRIFGPEFGRGVTPLLLLASGHTFNVIAGSPGWLLNMTGHQKTMVWITIASVFGNLLLNFVGVRLAGMNGVAGATLIALVGQNVMMIIAARRLVGVRTYAHAAPLRSFGLSFGRK